MDPVASGTVGGYVMFEQLWSLIRHGLALLGWVICMGLMAAACCWCCGYVVRSDAWRGRSPSRSPSSRPRPAHASSSPERLSLAEAEIADEAARGIREIERYLSTV